VLHGDGQADRSSAPGHAQSEQHHDDGSGCHGLHSLFGCKVPLQVSFASGKSDLLGLMKKKFN
jgi:hypothetical protein